MSGLGNLNLRKGDETVLVRIYREDMNLILEFRLTAKTVVEAIISRLMKTRVSARDRA